MASIIYPPNYIRINSEKFNLSNKLIEIPQCHIAFDQWQGTPIKETFGGKPLVNWENYPVFAELAIMKGFVNDGWDARWLETYGRGNKYPKCLTEWRDDKYKNQIDNPIAEKEINEMLNDISKLNNNSFSGCWDILAWKNGNIIFAESKRQKKDSIRQSQVQWLQAAIEYGLTPENFIIVQWDFRYFIGSKKVDL